MDRTPSGMGVGALRQTANENGMKSSIFARFSLARAPLAHALRIAATRSLYNLIEKLIT